jgi:hypothetical protein
MAWCRRYLISTIFCRKVTYHSRWLDILLYPENGGNVFTHNVGKLSNYTVLHPRWSSQAPPLGPQIRIIYGSFHNATTDVSDGMGVERWSTNSEARRNNHPGICSILKKTVKFFRQNGWWLGRDFSLLHRVKTNQLWAPPSPLSNGFRQRFPRRLSSQGVNLITHLHLVPRSNNSEGGQY